MDITANALGSFAGATGVGALCLLGIFLALDGRESNLFPTVEFYAKTSTWGIVATVPVLAISYLVGVLLTSGGEEIIRVLYGPSSAIEYQDLARLAPLDSEKSVLIATYRELKQHRAMLCGSSFSLLILALGALSEIRNLPNLKRVIRSAAIATLLLAVGTFHYAGVKSRQAHALVCTPNSASQQPGC